MSLKIKRLTGIKGLRRLKWSSVMMSWIFFGLSVIFLAGGFSLNYYFKKVCNDKSRFHETAQKVMLEKEQIAKQLLDFTLGVLKDPGKKNFFERDEFRQYVKEGIGLSVFERDSLIFWSDVSHPADHFLSQEFNDSSLIQSGNGWYRVMMKAEGDYKVLVSILIRTEYRYENDYLNHGFSPAFGLPEQVILKVSKSDYQIIDGDGNFLFSLIFKKKIPLSEAKVLILLLFYLAGFLLFLATLFQVHRRIAAYYKNAWLFIPAFLIDAVLLKAVLFHFKIPHALYESALFGPLLYASNEMLPSFGDLLINSLLFGVLAWVIYRYFDPLGNRKLKMNGYLRIIISAGIIALWGIAFTYLCGIWKGMIQDSVIAYTLNNVFNLNAYSLFGFLIMATLALGFTQISIRLLQFCMRITERPSGFWVSALFGSSCFLVFHVLSFSGLWVQMTAYLLLMAGLAVARPRAGERYLFARILFGLVFFSLFFTYILHQNNQFKEKEKRISLARKLSSGQDPIAEFLFEDLEKAMLEDKELKERLGMYPQMEDETRNYIINNYFRGYWDKYQTQITLCAPGDSLFIKPAMSNQSCVDYFSRLKEEFGKNTPGPHLYILNYGTGGNSYLADFEFMIDSARKVYAYIEMYSKFIPKGLGYPELLIDKKIFLNTDISNYSYARYRNGQLVDAYGKYYYSIQQDGRDTLAEDQGFFFRNDHEHLFYRIDQASELIITRKKVSLLEAMAPFSLLFLFFSLFLITFTVIISFPYRKAPVKLNFKNRLQLSMIAIILISFVLIGVSMYYYIRNLNENKNIENLSEKALSILIETQAKLAQYDSLTPDIEAYASNWLVKFSNVFFTDINLFDLEGKLISSSRPQIFNEGLIGPRMDPEAYKELSVNRKTIFIHKERIGSLDYYSAYVPFYNFENKQTAYLNLPYFARENELKQELSTFMMTFINIYVFLVAVAIIIALIIAGRMTRPLKEIRDKIGRVKLGGRNEKIVWERQMDEIGDLVNEYNRMVDELALSADLLARSERESAWREMAKQVAHEIKNPLTPMKLSVQHLEKAWNDKAPDWDSRLKRFTITLIEQIDSLSAIATAFSDFAKMPKSELDIIDLREVIKTATGTFAGNRVRILTLAAEEGEYYVRADKKQIIRVLNNLLTNAVQALEQTHNPRIEIAIVKENNMLRVSVSDNGPGISEEQKPRIFMPNFSTKSEGMGLGLAMVKSIIDGHGGSIWFLSREGEGASFYFELPELKAE
jgi:two-component system, NtrC family, nitrogen regulation sensor histidine kinase NtrY